MKTYAAVLSLLLCCAVCATARQNPTDYVDPFVGTGGHGHTYPGATAHFGMVLLSPDPRLTGWDGCSGYHYSDDIIYGFSHKHLSGTGISDYGDILLMPTAGDVRLNARGARGAADGYASRFSHRNERAAAGFYSVRLDDDQIPAELTVTPRVGFHRYTFRPAADANVILDLTHRDKVLDSGLRVTAGNRIEGFLQDVGSWVWLPTRVEFELSLDGVNFSKAAVATHDVPDRDTRVTVRELTSTFPRRDARFVRVRAYNYGAVPPWHAGAGGQAWIFVDEIIVD